MSTDFPTRIDYVEFTSPEMDKSKTFFAQAFGWEYIDYGPDYQDIQKAGLGGGIERGDLRAPLIVLYADDLDAALARVKEAGAEITKDVFSFPGGKRFEFQEPGGNLMAVWTKLDAQ